MKRLLTLCAVVAAFGLFAAPASAQNPIVLTAALLGSGETPAPGVSTGASGDASVVVDVAAQELSVTLRVWNLPADRPTTAAHIHVGSPSIAGPVIIDFPIPTGRTGDLSITFRAGAASFRVNTVWGMLTMTDIIQAMMSGNAYVNVHTSANPAGEIRGQLTLVQ